MAISFDRALGIHETAFKLRAERASVLSSNIANANTPNYKAKDINFQEALQQRMEPQSSPFKMEATSAGHMGFSQGSDAMVERYYRTPLQPSIDGNTVEEQVEHAAFMENTLEFQTAFTMLNSKFKGLTKAIKGE